MSLFSSEVTTIFCKRFPNASLKKLSAEDLGIGIEDIELVGSVLLGKGSFGVVESGKYANNDVAIKYLDIGENLEELANIVVEISIMQGHEHDRLVKYIGSGIRNSGSQAFIVMELCQFGSLRQCLRDHELGWPRIIQLLLDTCEGVKFLHDLRIIHRDIKTINVLICSSWRAKLCDSSFATSRDSTSKLEFSYGTEEFMSPEIALCMNWDLPTDLFSLGILMCEVITGREPCSSFMMRHARNGFALEESEIRESLLPDCPDQLEALAYQCCDVEPNHRPNVQQCLEELEAVLFDLQISADNEDSVKDCARNETNNQVDDESSIDSNEFVIADEVDDSIGNVMVMGDMSDMPADVPVTVLMSTTPSQDADHVEAANSTVALDTVQRLTNLDADLHRLNKENECLRSMLRDLTESVAAQLRCAVEAVKIECYREYEQQFDNMSRRIQLLEDHAQSSPRTMDDLQSAMTAILVNMNDVNDQYKQFSLEQRTMSEQLDTVNAAQEHVTSRLGEFEQWKLSCQSTLPSAIVLTHQILTDSDSHAQNCSLDESDTHSQASTQPSTTAQLSINESEISSAIQSFPSYPTVSIQPMAPRGNVENCNRYKPSDTPPRVPSVRPSIYGDNARLDAVGASSIDLRKALGSFLNIIEKCEDSSSIQLSASPSTKAVVDNTKLVQQSSAEKRDRVGGGGTGLTIKPAPWDDDQGLVQEPAHVRRSKLNGGGATGIQESSDTPNGKDPSSSQILLSHKKNAVVYSFTNTPTRRQGFSSPGRGEERNLGQPSAANSLSSRKPTSALTPSIGRIGTPRSQEVDSSLVKNFFRAEPTVDNCNSTMKARHPPSQLQTRSSHNPLTHAQSAPSPAGTPGRSASAHVTRAMATSSPTSRTSRLADVITRPVTTPARPRQTVETVHSAVSRAPATGIKQQPLSDHIKQPRSSSASREQSKSLQSVMFRYKM